MYWRPIFPRLLHPPALNRRKLHNPRNMESFFVRCKSLNGPAWLLLVFTPGNLWKISEYLFHIVSHFGVVRCHGPFFKMTCVNSGPVILYTLVAQIKHDSRTPE